MRPSHQACSPGPPSHHPHHHIVAHTSTSTLVHQLPPISTQCTRCSLGVKESEVGRGEDGCTTQGWEDDNPCTTRDLSSRYPHSTLDALVIHIRPNLRASRVTSWDIPAPVTTHLATAPRTLLCSHGPVTLLHTAEGLMVPMKGCLMRPLHNWARPWTPVHPRPT